MGSVAKLMAKNGMGVGSVPVAFLHILAVQFLVSLEKNAAARCTLVEWNLITRIFGRVDLFISSL